jgi:chromosome segregation ATPase
MSKFLTFLLFLSLLALGVQKSGILEAKPCSEPISYYLGSFDTRFGLSRGALISALAEAEKMWEGAAKKELFIFTEEKSDLPINLIYDSRQEATIELNEIEEEVERTESAYRGLEERYAALKSDHIALKSSYETAVRNFELHQAAYEQSVERWNSGNRTSANEFQALEAERAALEAEIQALKSLESRLNSKVSEINSMVSRLNLLAKELNLNADEYNTIGAMRGETFTGGLYAHDKNGDRIDIYEFESREKLVRVLAHELGHALGLEHVTDPNAIMYELNKSTRLVLAASDIKALEALCSIKQ